MQKSNSRIIDFLHKTRFNAASLPLSSFIISNSFQNPFHPGFYDLKLNMFLLTCCFIFMLESFSFFRTKDIQCCQTHTLCMWKIIIFILLSVILNLDKKLNSLIELVGHNVSLMEEIFLFMQTSRATIKISNFSRHKRYSI